MGTNGKAAVIVIAATPVALIGSLPGVAIGAIGKGNTAMAVAGGVIAVAGGLVAEFYFIKAIIK